jgi:hypothetical protein
VASIEQRVERVEVHVDAQHERFTELRNDLRRFQQEVSARFAEIDARFVQIDARFVQIDGRFIQLEGRFLALEQKVDIGFAGVRHEMALQFRWLVGITLTGMLTIAAAILAG